MLNRKFTALVLTGVFLALASCRDSDQYPPPTPATTPATATAPMTAATAPATATAPAH